MSNKDFPYFSSDHSISLRQDLLVDFIRKVTRDSSTDLNHLNLDNKQLTYIYCDLFCFAN